VPRKRDRGRIDPPQRLTVTLDDMAFEGGALARDAYTYIHTLMVAGIIVAAVGDAMSSATSTRTMDDGRRSMALAAGEDNV